MKIEDYWALVAGYGCWICKKTPSLHHPFGGSMKLRGIHKAGSAKTSDWLVIPLCYEHHQGNEGVHHLGVLTWEAKYGGQAGMIDGIMALSGVDVWELAKQEKQVAPKPYKNLKKKPSSGKLTRPTKVLPRR